MNIDKGEVLRYLRYQGDVIDPITEELIDASIDEIKQEASFNYIYEIFNINKEKGRIQLEDTTLEFSGNDIYHHLKNSERCAVLAATLGYKVDRLIKYYSKIDMTRCLILDACATAAVEELCDQVQEEVREMAGKENFNITHRYSPGYGDFSIKIQPKILNNLKTQVKIGLTVTDSLILIPRKSVTAIIGLSKYPTSSKKRSCEDCSNYKSCIYAKEGGLCGI